MGKKPKMIKYPNPCHANSYIIIAYDPKLDSPVPLGSKKKKP